MNDINSTSLHGCTPSKLEQSVPTQSKVTDDKNLELGHTCERTRMTMSLCKSAWRPVQSKAHVPVAIRFSKVHDSGRF